MLGCWVWGLVWVRVSVGLALGAAAGSVRSAGWGWVCRLSCQEAVQVVLCCSLVQVYPTGLPLALCFARCVDL